MLRLHYAGRNVARRLAARSPIWHERTLAAPPGVYVRGLSFRSQQPEHTEPKPSRNKDLQFWRALCFGTAAFASMGPWAPLSRTLHADAVKTPAPIDVDSLPIPIPKDQMKIKLYQYDVCPFCNKVRAYLDYHKIPYTVVEVDPLGKKELKQFSADYRKVPIAVVNDRQINGSGLIISEIHKTVYGSGQDTSADADWIDWVDNHLIHLITPNIYGTPGESLQTFEYIADNAKFTAWQRFSVRYTGAAAMYIVGRRSKKKYNIEEPRAAMYDAINKWTGAVKEKGGVFLAGPSSPGTADLAVYGVLRAIMLFDTFKDIKANCADFEPWFERTRLAVGEPAIVERL
jgi:microsomal prostaglandin-E synthase 2